MTVGELVLNEIGGRIQRGVTKRADALLTNALTDLGIWDAEVLDATAYGGSFEVEDGSEPRFGGYGGAVRLIVLPKEEE